MEPRGIAHRFACTALAVMLAGFAASSEIGPPKKEHWSESRSFVLRVNDRAKTLTLKHDTGNGFAVDWSIKYPQGSAPVTAYVTDDGQHVVLCDVAENYGNETVLVFLDRYGGVVKSYEAVDYLGESDLMDRIVRPGGIRWTIPELQFLDEELGQFQLITAAGTPLAFDLQTGELLDQEPDLDSRISEKGLAQVPVLLASDDASDRERGARLARTLDDKSSIDALIALLDDATVTGTNIREGVFSEILGVQSSAGSALTKLMGAEAAPLFEAKLEGASRHMLLTWIRYLTDVGAAASSDKVLELTKDPRRIIASDAIIAVLRTDDCTVLKQNLDWLQHEEDWVRLEAAILIAEKGTESDAALLVPAMLAGGPLTSFRSVRALVKLSPPDLVQLLTQMADGERSSAQAESVVELARRGDTDRQEQIVRWLHLFASEDTARNELPMLYNGTKDVAKLLAETRPPGAEDALRAVALHESLRVKVHAFGALAAMDHVDALLELRRLASTGGSYDRRYAIEWLGYCRDVEFVPELTLMLVDREPRIREAASSALDEIGVTDPPGGLAVAQADPPESGGGSRLAEAVIVGAVVLLAGGAAVLVRRHYLRGRA